MTPDEVGIIAEAVSVGWLLRSGKRLVVLTEYQRRCRAAGVPAVVGRIGGKAAEMGFISTNDVDVWKGPAADLEHEAARIVEGLQAATVESGDIEALPLFVGVA